jgi:uncharacterized protein YpuA (DUF1002 family)
MIKKICLTLMVTVFAMTFFAAPVLAADSGEQRVTLGADLNASQIAEIYSDFNIERGDVKELFVTNTEEREYLSGLVPDEKIGKNALSSIFITTLDEGSGISVTTKNINWCTEDMYINALSTAGIADASIIVSAPFEVSGTAALTGIYKAYSDITGIPLSELSKAAATEELITTGELADVIGSDQAVEVVNELKKILDKTRTMTDEELRKEILYIADVQNVALTEENISQIIGLSRTLEKLDFTDWQNRLIKMGKTIGKVQKANDGISSFFDSIKNFFTKIGQLF